MAGRARATASGNATSYEYRATFTGLSRLTLRPGETEKPGGNAGKGWMGLIGRMGHRTDGTYAGGGEESERGKGNGNGSFT